MRMSKIGDFPSRPVVKTPCFQCWGHGLDPWSGNLDPHAEWCGQINK